MSEEPSNYKECFVAFLDLMGVRNLVKACDKDVDRYKQVISALRETSDLTPFKSGRRDLETGESKDWTLQVQAFSDCVVLFIPTESDTLSWLLASVRRLHDRLLRLNIPVRGGITIGGMHWEDSWSSRDKELEERTPVAFGPGLVEAYTLECETAVYPRILLSNRLFEFVKSTKPKSFPFSDSPLITFCRQDMDGLYHLDVLHENVRRKDVINQLERTDEKGQPYLENVFDKTTYEDWMALVRDFITLNLDSVTGEKLESKYLWLARYHNAAVKRSGKGARIPIFQDELPDDKPVLTINLGKKPAE